MFVFFKIVENFKCSPILIFTNCNVDMRVRRIACPKVDNCSILTRDKLHHVPEVEPHCIFVSARMKWKHNKVMRVVNDDWYESLDVMSLLDILFSGRDCSAEAFDKDLVDVVFGRLCDRQCPPFRENDMTEKLVVLNRFDVENIVIYRGLCQCVYLTKY